MAVVVVERSFEEATPFERLQAQEQAVAWCLEQHRVEWVRSFMSRDGRHNICIYDAPDAEAVRATQRTGELPFDTIWSAQRLLPPRNGTPDSYEHVVVQRAMPQALSPEGAQALFEQGAYCRRIYRTELVESYLALDGMRVICRYSARDSESVRIANSQSQLPFERAWPAELLD